MRREFLVRPIEVDTPVAGTGEHVVVGPEAHGPRRSRPPAGMMMSKVEETRVALRELGLNQVVQVKNREG